MSPNASKNRDLINQYPFVSDILLDSMEPHGGLEGIQVDDLTIRIQKADGDLMFRCANNVGLDENSFVFCVDGKRKNQVMRRGEYLFAILKDGKIINRVNWPRNEEERRKSREVYGWSALWAGRSTLPSGESCYTDSIHDMVQCLVWVTVEAWHVDAGNDSSPNGRFGDFCDRSVAITIYEAPEQGFEKLQEDSSVYLNLSLNTRVMMRGVMEKDHDIVSMSGMLYEMCILFQDEVYFNGMKSMFDGGGVRGASGQFGAVKVLCAEMCGYDRLMLEDSMSFVTFQLRPNSKNLYVLGQDGTLPQIRNLVRTVVRMWNQNPDSRAAFKPDGKVSVM